MTRRRLKLIFGASLVKEPVIYQLGRKFEIVTNIRRADVTRDQGWVLLEVSGEPDELDKGVEYLESRGVKVEPAEGDLVEQRSPLTLTLRDKPVRDALPAPSDRSPGGRREYLP